MTDEQLKQIERRISEAEPDELRIMLRRLVQEVRRLKREVATAATE